jgi:hypothetical protein
MRHLSYPTPLTALLLLGALLFTALYTFFPAIPQPPSYHAFSDQRPLFGIPHWNNIWSSLLYIPLGLWGFSVARRLPDRNARWLWHALFLAIIAIGLGSTFYHLHPNHLRLAIDRLPIAVALMTFLSILVGEEKGSQWGLYLFPFAAGLGILTVAWWIQGETRGTGDLRPYLGLHLFVWLATLILAFFRKGRPRSLLLATALLFALSKALEYYDAQLFALLAHTIGGHPLKHLSAALAVVCLILYCRQKTAP